MFKCPLCKTTKFKYTESCECGWKKSSDNVYLKSSSFAFRRCYVIDCKNSDIDECGYNPKILMCRFHHDECTIRLFHDSPRADIVRAARYFDEQAKSKGMSGKDYFEATDPIGYAVSQKRMRRNYQDAKPVAENEKHVLDV